MGKTIQWTLHPTRALNSGWELGWSNGPCCRWWKTRWIRCEISLCALLWFKFLCKWVDHGQLFHLVYEKVKYKEESLEPHLWTYRSRITLDHLRQTLQEEKMRQDYPILSEFLEAVCYSITLLLANTHLILCTNTHTHTHTHTHVHIHTYIHTHIKGNWVACHPVPTRHSQAAAVPLWQIQSANRPEGCQETDNSGIYRSNT